MEDPLRLRCLIRHGGGGHFGGKGVSVDAGEGDLIRHGGGGASAIPARICRPRDGLPG